MLIDFALAVGGLALLLVAGDLLVRGAVALSLRLGVPAMIISLTVVAFGTSAPELVIAIRAALADAPGIVFGNVVGSNIANVLLVVGTPALISRIDTRRSHSGRNYVLMLFSTAVFIWLCLSGPLGPLQGLILLTLLAVMLFDAFRSGRKERLEKEDAGMGRVRLAALLLGGIVGLPLGAQLLLVGAQGLARDFGISEAVIGLTLVAIGTSLPELATTVAAALRRHADVVLGNVIGSNLFNIVAIMGIASLLGPLEPPQEILRLDLWVMLAASLALAPFVMRFAPIGRFAGALALGLYAIYIVVILGG